ncbi:MAG TPA: hypothetical protein VIM29_08080 [Bacillota bacterium]
MKINVQEELKRFKDLTTKKNTVAAGNLSPVLTYLMEQFTELKKADQQIREGIQQLVDEVKNLAGKEQHGPVAKRNHVLFSIYDQVDSLLKVAMVNQDQSQIETYRQLLEYLTTLFTMELNWVPIDAVGKKYNPYEYEGFATTVQHCQERHPQKLEIIRELRKGFSCREQIVRKPLVEFYE